MSGECWECGHVGDVHEHHVVPRSSGGTRTVPLCESCHGKAHHRDRAMSTSEMTRRALKAKKDRGERVGGVEYGRSVAADGVTLIRNANEAEMVAIAAWMRKRGATYRAITAELNAQGYTTRKGTPLQLTQVVRIIANAQAG